MRDVVVSGVGMTAFGKETGRTMKTLCNEAVGDALADASCYGSDVGYVYFSNVIAGLLQGQESTRGQVYLRETALHGIPTVNVENACASGATAFHSAWLAVGSGLVDVAVAVGAEQLMGFDKEATFNAMASGIDRDYIAGVRAELGADMEKRSLFMDVYAGLAADFMEQTGATAHDFAQVAAKNQVHGSLNPKAQYGVRRTAEEVLAARPIAGVLTLLMCAPMSDGAAAVVLTTPALAERAGAKAVRVRGVAIAAGITGRRGDLVSRAAGSAFEIAAVDPADVDIVEVHDATSPAELIAIEQLGLCAPGESVRLLRTGATTLGGSKPVNVSGGLVSKGHPLGATGLAQIVELTDQLRGRCGARQVEHASVAVAENAGGYIGPDAAVAAVAVLSN